MSQNTQSSPEIEKLEREIQSLEKEKENKQKKLEREIQSLEKEKENKQKKLEREIQSLEKEKENKQKKLEREIENIKRVLDQDYQSFVYQPNQNELQHLQKNQPTTIKKFEPYQLPQYALPEVGELFEDKNNYYLEIEDDDDLEKANEIAEKRYTDKPTKITAKTGE